MIIGGTHQSRKTEYISGERDGDGQCGYWNKSGEGWEIGVGMVSADRGGDSSIKEVTKQKQPGLVGFFHSPEVVGELGGCGGDRVVEGMTVRLDLELDRTYFRDGIDVYRRTWQHRIVNSSKHAIARANNLLIILILYGSNWVITNRIFTVVRNSSSSVSHQDARRSVTSYDQRIVAHRKILLIIGASGT
jgi:hypothetical protein